MRNETPVLVRKIFFLFCVFRYIYSHKERERDDWSSFRIHSCCRCDGIFCFVRNVYRVRLVFYFFIFRTVRLSNAFRQNIESDAGVYELDTVFVFKFEYIYLVEL